MVTDTIESLCLIKNKYLRGLILCYIPKSKSFYLIDFSKTFLYYTHDVWYGISMNGYRRQISSNEYNLPGTSTIHSRAHFILFKRKFLTRHDIVILEEKKNHLLRKLVLSRESNIRPWRKTNPNLEDNNTKYY